MWAIGWRTKILSTGKILLLLCSITALFWGGMAALDILLDRKIADWFEDTFFQDMGYATFLNGGKWHVYDLKWSVLKDFLYRWGILLVALWTVSILVTAVVARIRAERRAARELEWLTRQYFSRPDGIHFPEKFSNMEDYAAALKDKFRHNESMLRAESVRKNDLIAYLAHDLKTPLTSVIGYLSLLQEAPDMPPEQRSKYTGIALDKALRLESLINEFFDITRYNLHEIVLERESFDLGYMLLQMADEFYPLLEQHGKNISIQADEELPIVADPDKLARVLNNILKNAVAYSYDNTEISIQAHRRDEAIQVDISNFGKTIPQAKLDVIFEKFYRLDDARSSNTGGAGLGLAIAKEIVCAHGGSISLTSANQVTTFHVTIPVGNPVSSPEGLGNP